MSATATVPALVDDEEHVSPQVAPPLPLEHHVVGMVRALEAAKSQAEQALVLLQWTSRDHAAVADALTTLEQCAVNARNAHAIYVELLNCRGQA